MALAATTVWELRTDAADTNGGGFDPVLGASATDWSQQALPHANGTNLTVDVTTNTDVTPDGYTPVATDVGNLIQITTTGGGAAFTVGFYQIASIQSGKWRLDRSPAATSSAGATWALGGAMLSPALVVSTLGPIVAGNKIWMRGGANPTSTPFVITVNTASVAGGKVSSNTQCAVFGYGTTRGDTGRAVFKIGVNLTGGMWSSSGTKILKNVEFDGNRTNFTAGSALTINGTLINCLVHDCAAAGASPTVAYGCSFYNNSGVGCTATLSNIVNCVAYNNGTFGFTGSFFTNCVAYGNGSGGFTAANDSNLYGCVAYGNTGPGITLPATNNSTSANCISYGNTTYGWASGGSTHALITCAYGANLTADLQNVLTEIGSILLTANPFVDSANGNFALNGYGRSVLAGSGYGQIGASGATGSMTTMPSIGAAQAGSPQAAVSILGNMFGSDPASFGGWPAPSGGQPTPLFS